MKIKYDPDTDGPDMRFADAPVAETEEVRPGIMLDFDARGRIVAIEGLDASIHLANGAELGKLAAA